MAVSTTNAFDGPFIANGVATTFPFTFTALTDADVTVEIDGVAVSGYSVTIASGGGGSVIFDSAPTSGEIYILLEPSFEQLTQFEDGSGWLASPVNRVNDRAALRDQRNRRDTDRALKVPMGESPPPMASLAGSDGKALGIVDGVIQPVPFNGADGAQSAADANTAKLGAQTAQGLAEAARDASQTAQGLSEAARDAAGEQATLATGQAIISTTGANAAAAAAAAVGILPAVASAIPYTVTGIQLGAPGNSATVNGEFDLIVTGGPLGHRARVVVSGGAITRAYVVPEAAGVSATNTAPVYTLPTIAGLTGATAPTATVGALGETQTFWAMSSDYTQLLLWKVASGALAPVNGPDSVQVKQTLSAGLIAMGLSVAALNAIISSLTSTLGGSFTTNATLGSGGTAAALIGTVPSDCTVDQVSLPIIAAGALSLIRVRSLGGNSYQLIEKVPVVAGTANADNLFATPNWRFSAGDFIGYETGTGTVGYSTTATGYTGIGLGAAVSGTQTWTSYSNRRFGGTASYTVRSVSVGSSNLSAELEARIEKGEAAGDSVVITNTTVGTATAAWNANLGGPAGYQIGSVPAASKVTSVTLPISSTGPLNILHLRPAGGLSFTLVAKYAATATVGNADNTFTGFNGGIGISTQANDVIGYELLSGGATVKNIGPNSNTAVGIAAAVSGTQTWSTFGRTYGGTFVYKVTALVLAPSNMGAALQGALSKPVVTYSQGFGSSAPASWTFGGSWTHPSNGALSPAGAADMSVYAKLTQASLFHDEDRVIRLWFQPQATGSKFAFGYWRSVGWRGTLVVVDDTAGTIGFAQANTSAGAAQDTSWTTAPTVVVSAAMPALTAGRDYVLELRRNKRISSATVRDMVTGAVIATLSEGSNDGVVIRLSGLQFGSPFFAAMIGQTLIKRVFASSGRKNPRAMMIGDSITEGVFDNNLLNSQRWAQITKDALGGNAVIAGLSGSTASEIAPLLLNEIPAIKPDWIIEAFGTNDQNSGLATFQTNINNLVSYCAANGINLAVAKIQPVPTRVFDQLNAFLDTLPNSVRRIHFDRALTTNNDGVTFNSAYYGSDPLHPNSTGHSLMAARVQADLPEIFDLAKS